MTEAIVASGGSAAPPPRKKRWLCSDSYAYGQQRQRAAAAAAKWHGAGGGDGFVVWSSASTDATPSSSSSSSASWPLPSTPPTTATRAAAEDGVPFDGGWYSSERCYYDLHGTCKKGDSCDFRHGEGTPSRKTAHQYSSDYGGRGWGSGSAGYGGGSGWGASAGGGGGGGGGGGAASWGSSWKGRGDDDAYWGSESTPCAMFQLGCCYFERWCYQAHIPAEPEKDLRLGLCEEFVRTGSCSNKASCREAHGREELQTPKVYIGMPGYKACLCTYHMVGERCDAGRDLCFDAHGLLELRRLPSSAPRSLTVGAPGGSFVFSDSHCHLDHVLKSRKFGTYWFLRNQRCKRGPCTYGSNCMYVHEGDQPQPRKLERADFEALAAEIEAVPGGTFGGCIHSCCDIDEIEEALRIVEWGRELLDGKIYVSFGIHPTNFEELTPEVEARLRAVLEACGKQAVAWGECGLDYYRRKSDVEEDPKTRDKMKESFARQARIAVRRGLPLVVHSRDAEADTLEVLRREVPPTHPVHLHSFMGSLQMMDEFLRSFPASCVGIAGAITYCGMEDAEGLTPIAKALPLDRLLLETDGPYMAPNPHRGEESHPGHIPWIADGVARVKGVSAHEVMATAHANFRRLYGI